VSKIETLCRNYKRVCGLPWDRNTSGAQRVWIAVYDKEDERKLRLRLGFFQEATLATGHRWHRCDLTDAFADWFLQPDIVGFAESYFEAPDLLDDGPLAEFQQALADRLIAEMQALEDPQETVFAITGAGSLFGFTRISKLLPLIESFVRGRLLVFFPGTYEINNYHLLDARDGWNYLAVPITTQEGELRG
jgi:hypothetical protein